jgi:hypothetical protein
VHERPPTADDNQKTVPRESKTRPRRYAPDFFAALRSFDLANRLTPSLQAFSVAE